MNTGMREKDGHKERGGTATLLAQGGLVCVGLVTERRQEREEKLGPAVGLKGSRFGCRCYMIQAAAYLIIVNIVGRGGGESKRDQHQPQCRLRVAPRSRHVSLRRKEHPVHKQGNTPLSQYGSRTVIQIHPQSPSHDSARPSDTEFRTPLGTYYECVVHHWTQKRDTSGTLLGQRSDKARVT